jgi:hypothetical protein
LHDEICLIRHDISLRTEGMMPCVPFGSHAMRGTSEEVPHVFGDGRIVNRRAPLMIFRPNIRA